MHRYKKNNLFCWALELEAKGSVTCVNKECNFTGHELMDVVMHFRHCHEKNVVDRKICTYCCRTVDNQLQLDTHVLLLHSGKDRQSIIAEYNGEQSFTKNQQLSVHEKMWTIFFERSGYVKCMVPLCHFVCDSVPAMKTHFMRCDKSFWSTLRYGCGVCDGRLPSAEALGTHFDAHRTVKFDESKFRKWARQLKYNGVVVCPVRYCRYLSESAKSMYEHFTSCRWPRADDFVVCPDCQSWFDDDASLTRHRKKFETVEPRDGEIIVSGVEPNTDVCEIPYVACGDKLSNFLNQNGKNQGSWMPKNENTVFKIDVKFKDIEWKISVPYKAEKSSESRKFKSFQALINKKAEESAEFIRSITPWTSITRFPLSHALPEKYLKMNNSKNVLSKEIHKEQLNQKNGLKVMNNLKKTRIKKKVNNLKKAGEKIIDEVTDQKEKDLDNEDIRCLRKVVGLSKSSYEKSPFLNDMFVYPVHVNNKNLTYSRKSVPKENNVMEEVDSSVSVQRNPVDPSPPVDSVSDVAEATTSRGKRKQGKGPKLGDETDSPPTKQARTKKQGGPTGDSKSKKPKKKLGKEESPDGETPTPETSSKRVRKPKKKFDDSPEPGKSPAEEEKKSQPEPSQPTSPQETPKPPPKRSQRKSKKKSYAEDVLSEEDLKAFLGEAGLEKPAKKGRGPGKKSLPEPVNSEEDSKLDTDQVKKKKSPKKKQETEPTPEGEVAPKRKTGRPRKIQEPVADDENVEGESEPKGKRGFKRRTLIDENDDRISFETVLTDPDLEVKCGVCSEAMNVLHYQKKHMAKHNYLCWLDTEEPLDISNEELMERHLFKVYLRVPRVTFKCELCGVTKKSAKGFISHKRFCGKSELEKTELMIACDVCGRIMKPSSLDGHKLSVHRGPTIEIPAEPVAPEDTASPKMRKAASRCIGKMAEMVASNVEVEKDEEEEEEEGNNDIWVQTFYSRNKRRLHKYILDLWTKVLNNKEKARCPISSCTFESGNIDDLKHHYRQCNSSELEFKCDECSYTSFDEKDMINHIKDAHIFKKRAETKQAKKDLDFDAGKEALLFGSASIPYLKTGELSLRTGPHFFAPALELTRKQRSLYFSSEKLYPMYNVDWDNWRELTTFEGNDYMPLTDESIRVCFGDEEWTKMKKFERKGIVGDPDTMEVLFTGGPVLCLAWAPTTDLQFLAVSVGKSMEKVGDKIGVHSGPGSIQIWTLGENHNQQQKVSGVVEFGYLLCHDMGVAWGMEWCPSGACDENRLGLLALATSSGKIPIYTLPHPLPSNRTVAYKPEPSLILEVGTLDQYPCTRLNWSPVKPHKIIAAGFTNGLIAVWDITNESSLLRNGRTVYPYKLFVAHNSIVTGVQLSYVSENYLWTSSADKFVKLWDLNDTTVPQSEHQRGVVTDIGYLQHWMSSVYSLDDIYATGQASVALQTVRNYVMQPQSFVTGVDAAALSVSVNNWLNCFATSYDNGQVNLVLARKLSPNVNEDRRKFIKALITADLRPVVSDLSENNEADDDEFIDCDSYSAVADKYGLVINTDQGLSTVTLKGNNPGFYDLYPLVAANKVCWNTNPSSFLTLAVGYQSGFVMIPTISLNKLEHQLTLDINKKS